ncbi:MULTISPECIES: pyridoxal-phosphate dependent enzyme [unclassified Francisella]|uniref:pyridoxal-phosphate dependent enzyme n=1 Tax=unclassified Francisella TaxID=2610885 RepID=UPI002E37E69B|nr:MULTISPECIES: pyridoxal-phosphate dependent enzyme [unclassified Francisella]MED7818381.1 pyridoxal-phosphate dependent enzyme [Francisella sp. 19S2-4]MED7829217.1 pyridoxal-phosphate dependent enzyme [Francisella sp. 19S2-10]
MIYNNILETIGKTPVVRLNNIGEDLPCELYAKCEFFNPGGSIKDRIAYRMIEEAEKEGRIRPGDILIEPTSGNTGIGLALAGSVKGYKVIIVMPEKMSQEKQLVLERLGAQIIRTPTEAAFDAPDSHISVARRLAERLPNAHVLDQYANQDNPKAHYYGTAEEIIIDFPEGLDMVVMGVGTGGTLTGIAKRLKEEWPNIKIIGVDPEGSILGGGDQVSDFQVEGIGYDFFPKVFDSSIVDKFYKSNDHDSFKMARKLMQKEGFLCGGSCGAAVCGLIEAAKDLKAGQKALVLLPDSIRNYLGKYANNDWLKSEGFADIIEQTPLYATQADIKK